MYTCIYLHIHMYVQVLCKTVHLQASSIETDESRAAAAAALLVPVVEKVVAVWCNMLQYVRRVAVYSSVWKCVAV